MPDKQHQRFALTDASYLSAVKRDIAQLARTAAFSEMEVGRINIVVSEMGSNLVRHAADGGEILVRLLQENDQPGIELISLDHGPGMADPHRMLQDGVSTFGSSGEGLGAIKRQSDFFDFYSQTETGSVFLSRIYKTVAFSAKKPLDRKMEIGAVLVAKRTGEVCGDGWSLQHSEDSTYLLALDGLGHGEFAHEAAQQAIRAFNHSQTTSISEKLLEIHNQIKSTRGAVGAIAKIGAPNADLHFCGIGNISAKILSFNSAATLSVAKNLMSYNGTLGHVIPTRFDIQTAEWHPGNLLLMHSDGIKTNVDPGRYPKLNQHDATLIAAVLYRDFNRGTDDALVLIAKAKK